MTTALDLLQRRSDADEADAIFGALVLRDVRMVKWAGEVLGDGSPRRVDLGSARASYFLGEARVRCRFDQEVTIDGTDDVRLSQISVAVVADFRRKDANGPALDRLDENTIRTVLIPAAWEIAYPYVREGVQTMSTRLGLDAVALGLLDPAILAPSDVHIRGVAEFRSPD